MATYNSCTLVLKESLSKVILLKQNKRKEEQTKQNINLLYEF